MNEKVCDTVFSHHVCRLLLLLAHFFEFKLIKSETEEQIFLPSYKVHTRTNTHTHICRHTYTCMRNYTSSYRIRQQFVRNVCNIRKFDLICMVAMLHLHSTLRVLQCSIAKRFTVTKQTHSLIFIISSFAFNAERGNGVNQKLTTNLPVCLGDTNGDGLS